MCWGESPGAGIKVTLLTDTRLLPSSPSSALGWWRWPEEAPLTVCVPPQYMGCIEVLRSMRSLDFNTRTQVTRYGPVVPLFCTPNAARSPQWPWVLPFPGALWRGGGTGTGSGGALPRGIPPTRGDTDEGHCRGSVGGKRRREVAPAGIMYRRPMTWGSAAWRLRHPGLRGLMPPDPTEPQAGDAAEEGARGLQQ